jgi:uncharacterized protein with HEPN domain
MEEAKTFPEFKQNDEKIDAVILNLEQIGETAKKLSSEIATLSIYRLAQDYWIT